MLQQRSRSALSTPPYGTGACFSFNMMGKRMIGFLITSTICYRPEAMLALILAGLSIPGRWVCSDSSFGGLEVQR